MKKLFRWIGFAFILSLCGLTIYGFIWVRQYQKLADEEPEIILSPDISDITYCTIDSVPLKMDLCFPGKAKPPYPLLVYMHGGSLTSGDKRKGSGVIDIPAMAERGYAVAAINHDVKYDVGEYMDESSQVDAVVDMFGPTHLTHPMGWLQRWLLRRAFGSDSASDARLIEASPVEYVTRQAPPFLILHGEQDTAVPVEQAQVLYQKLQDADVQATLIIVKNADHNFKPIGGVIQPTRTEISEAMGDFFDGILK